jgi:hypothetical protein
MKAYETVLSWLSSGCETFTFQPDQPAGNGAAVAAWKSANRRSPPGAWSIRGMPADATT